MGNGTGRLQTLEGISSGVEDLFISNAATLACLAGIESCTYMEKLSLTTCGVSSLEPLRGLSHMKELLVSHCCVTSLEGLGSMPLEALRLIHCHALTNLSGVGRLSSLQSLEVMYCDVTSLQPLSELGEGLEELRVSYCKRVQEEVLGLPGVKSTADVVVRGSKVRVVLAGGEEMYCMV
jgi:Leucine-rich repeat (LRR) protein